MSWFHNRYTERPASKNKAARIAWDVMTVRAAHMKPPRCIVRLWFADEMDDGVWCAKLNGAADADRSHDYLEMDVLSVRDRKNNPHKYAA